VPHQNFLQAESTLPHPSAQPHVPQVLVPGKFRYYSDDLFRNVNLSSEMSVAATAP